MEELLEKTESVCPICLKVLPAEIWERGDEVFIERECPEHGRFSAAIWRGLPSFRTWRRPKTPIKIKSQTSKNLGCPYDCGLCPDHGQYPCTVLLELTSRCDLSCPVCFAASGGEASEKSDFRPVEELVSALYWIHKTAGQVVLQLSGGEPTLYPELPSLAIEASRLFPAVQLNTNGLSLARDPKLAKTLAQSGISWVFLQFDGLNDKVYEALRGRPLLSEKLLAIEACEKAGLSVVLVPTAVRGLNDQELGPMVDWARNRPIVRGIHVQSMTQSGRNVFSEPELSLTLPEAIRAFAKGGEGAVRPELAFPPGCEHERCSFHLRFRREPDGRLIPRTPRIDDCGCGQAGCPPKSTSLAASPEETNLNRTRAVDVIIQSWKGAREAAPSASDEFNLAENGENPKIGQNDGQKSQSGDGEKLPLKNLSIPMAKPKAQTLDDFLEKARRETFSLTGMAFQDRHNLDLARLKGCCVHIYKEPRQLIPFCAMNLTDAEGRSLHRKKGGAEK